MGQRYDVCTPRPKGEGNGTWWHKVGTAWKNDKGLVTVYLDSYPVPDPEKGNKAVMMLFEPKERSETAAVQKSKTTSGFETEEEIPF